MDNNTSSSTNTGYTEGQSTARTPFFNGSNYSYWATRTRIYMQANSFDSWNITQKEYTLPTAAYTEWSTNDKNEATANAKAMNMLHCALDRNEFNRICMCNTAYEIWRTLKITHEGTNKVKPRYPCLRISFKILE